MKKFLGSAAGRALIRFVRVVVYGAIAGGAAAGADAEVVDLSPVLGTSLSVALTGLLVALDKWARTRSNRVESNPPPTLGNSVGPPPPTGTIV